MKRILSIIVCMCMCVLVLSPTYAIHDYESSKELTKGKIYSPTYPNAYIIENTVYTQQNIHSVTQTVSATVFVEEEYVVNENGNVVITSSRLLSEDEVLAIGVENFEDINGSKASAIQKAYSSRSATNSRGKLTITFSGTYSVSGNSVMCDLDGNASWSAGPVPLSSTNPSTGNDFMGIIWSGDFTSSGTSITTTSSISGYEPPVKTLRASFPNAGRVWEFSEAWEVNRPGDPLSIYLTNINVGTTVRKNNMTGNGNTAEAVLQYIHTYGAVQGAISVDSTGLGFSLTNVTNQWSIACTVTNIPY